MKSQTLMGYPVHITPHLDNVPRMTLSENVPVTPEFRAETNKWMLEFFGVENKVIVTHDPAAIFVGVGTFSELRRQRFEGMGSRPYGEIAYPGSTEFGKGTAHLMDDGAPYRYAPSVKALLDT